MTLKLIGFLLFFLFGSTLIGLFASLFYVFLIKAPLPLVLSTLFGIAAIPFAALALFQKFYQRQAITLEEMIIGGVLGLLIVIYGLTLTFGLRRRMERLEHKTRPAMSRLFPTPPEIAPWKG